MAKKRTNQIYGIASISFALKGAEFPMTKQELIDKYGNKHIQWKKGQSNTLKNILDSTQSKKYNSMTDLVSAISKSEKVFGYG